MKKKPDKYDRAIAYLKTHPDEITQHWNAPGYKPVGVLFRYCGRRQASAFGCLVQVRSGTHPAETPALTRAIRADKRIPYSSEGITVKSLPVFAEWQRRLDKELKRK